MRHLTDEEYDVLDEELTKTDPKLTDIPGPFARQRMLLDALDEVSANYIRAKSEELQKIPTKIVAEMIQEKIASEINVAKV